MDAYLAQNRLGSRGELEPRHQEKLRSQVLNVLIGRELLWQDAQARGAVASDQEVAQAMALQSQRFGSADAFEEKLRAGGLDRDGYSQDLKRRLSVHRLVNEHLSQTIEITDGEVAAYYEANAERFRRPEEVRARHILLKLDENASRDEEARVLARIRDSRGGNYYDSCFGQRMTGTGIYAELIAQRFAAASRRLGFGEEPELDCTQFRAPRASSREQLDLF